GEDDVAEVRLGVGAVDGGVVERGDDRVLLAEPGDPNPVRVAVADDVQDAAADERRDVPGRHRTVFESFRREDDALPVRVFAREGIHGRPPQYQDVNQGSITWSLTERLSELIARYRSNADVTCEFSFCNTRIGCRDRRRVRKM